MQIAVGAVGILKKGPEAELVAAYRWRFDGLGRQLGFKAIRVAEIDPAKSLPRGQRQTREADQLLAPISREATIIVLDEGGKPITSKDLADMLAKFRDEGVSETWFLIGGADGHGPAIRNLVQSGKAKPMAFGSATWPHMLVRAMLCEQLYRALTILGNHPYHRE